MRVNASGISQTKIPESMSRGRKFSSGFAIKTDRLESQTTTVTAKPLVQPGTPSSAPCALELRQPGFTLSLLSRVVVGGLLLPLSKQVRTRQPGTLTITSCSWRKPPCRAYLHHGSSFLKD